MSILYNEKTGSCHGAWWMCSHFPSVVVNNNRPPWCNFLHLTPPPAHTHKHMYVWKIMGEIQLVLKEEINFELLRAHVQYTNKMQLGSVTKVGPGSNVYWTTFLCHKAKHQEAQSITDHHVRFCPVGWSDGASYILSEYPSVSDISSRKTLEAGMEEQLFGVKWQPRTFALW